ncbi:hypothetical protein ANTQUA_LOCUS3580 [Anthophora quadrimaculata]
MDRNTCSSIVLTILNIDFTNLSFSRSPDITPLDFFLWGTLKEKVYKEVPTTPYDMQQRIIASCALISSDAVRLASQSIVKRIQWCIDSDGHHFKHLL